MTDWLIDWLITIRSWLYITISYSLDKTIFGTLIWRTGYYNVQWTVEIVTIGTAITVPPVMNKPMYNYFRFWRLYLFPVYQDGRQSYRQWNAWPRKREDSYWNFFTYIICSLIWFLPRFRRINVMPIYFRYNIASHYTKDWIRWVVFYLFYVLYFDTLWLITHIVRPRSSY